MATAKSQLLTDLRQAYIDVLIKHNMLYHFDDNVGDIVWETAKPSPLELVAVQAITDALYDEELFDLVTRTHHAFMEE